MRFIGPEEGGVAAVLRTPGLMQMYLLLGLPCLMLFPLLMVEVKEQKEMSTVVHKRMEFPQGPPMICVFLDFYIFPCTWKPLPPWLP
jgi:hypothetical protein